MNGNLWGLLLVVVAALVWWIGFSGRQGQVKSALFSAGDGPGPQPPPDPGGSGTGTPPSQAAILGG